MKDDESPWSRAKIGGAPRRPSSARTPGKPMRRGHGGEAPAASTAIDSGRRYERHDIDSGSPGAKAPREARLYGLNACLAAFARRPEALRKVYLTQARIPALKDVLAWCVRHRLGYRVVEETDLDKLTASRHHEGVCFDLKRTPAPTFDALLATLPPAPQPSLLLWLDGVGNPHNLGALLRSAAHFGAAGVVVPMEAGLDVSGAAARVAEGAAEIVPVVQAASASAAIDALRAHGFRVAATVPREGMSLYATALPARLALVFGAEGEGMSAPMIASADLRLTIPGSGAIESLNVAASVAVVLGEYWRQHPGVPGR